MRGFEAEDGRWVAHIDGPFAGALSRLAQQIATQLAGRADIATSADWDGLLHELRPGDSAPATREAPAGIDPADDLARLNPPASRDDPERAAEFRRLTRAELDIERIQRLRGFADSLAVGKRNILRPVRLAVTPEEAGRLAATLNDLRLVLGQRLEITDAESAEAVYERAESGDPGAVNAVLYLVASALQDSLVALLTGAAE